VQEKRPKIHNFILEQPLNLQLINCCWWLILLLKIFFDANHMTSRSVRIEKNMMLFSVTKTQLTSTTEGIRRAYL